MKYLTLFAAGAAASLVRRAEVDTIIGDIATMQELFQTLATNIGAYSGGEDEDIAVDLRNLVLAINAADADTRSLSGPFTESDSKSLAIPIQDLGVDIGQAMDALIAKKTELVAACYGGLIYQSLMDQQMQGEDFQTDLNKRIYSTVQPMINQLAKPMNDNMERGIDAFEGENDSCSAPQSAQTTPAGSSGSNPTSSATGSAATSSAGPYSNSTISATSLGSTSTSVAGQGSPSNTRGPGVQSSGAAATQPYAWSAGGWGSSPQSTGSQAAGSSPTGTGSSPQQTGTSPSSGAGSNPAGSGTGSVPGSTSTSTVATGSASNIVSSFGFVLIASLAVLAL